MGKEQIVRIPRVFAINNVNIDKDIEIDCIYLDQCREEVKYPKHIDSSFSCKMCPVKGRYNKKRKTIFKPENYLKGIDPQEPRYF